MATLELDAGSRRDQVTVSLLGELDIVSAPAGLAVLAEAAIRGQFVVVDMAELDFLDCNAVRLLMHIRVVAQESGGDMVLANPRGAALRLLTILCPTDAPAEALSRTVSETAPVLINAQVSSVASNQSRRRSHLLPAARQSAAAYVFSELPVARIGGLAHRDHRPAE